jgi:hypothetical protein
MTKEERHLAEIVARIIDIRRTHVKINPTWIATEALKEIDPANRSVALVRIGCHLQLRQIAREQCRTLFEDSEGDDEPRFAAIEGLQWRYPAQRSKEEHEPQYILRDHMSDADVAYNVERLRREGRAKLAHADTLEAWGRARRRRGTA